MKFRIIELFDWIKRLPPDLINLTSSGMPGPASLDDIGLEGENLPLKGDNYYGYQPLKGIIASRYNTDPDHVAITPGASMANFALFASLADRGDRIMVEYPVYQPFVRTAEAITGREPLFLRRHRRNRYRIDDKQTGLKDENIKLLMLTNLHNPTGVFDPPETIIRLAESIASQNGWLVVDEVFLPFLEGYDRKCAAQLHDRIISTCSLTKVWGMSGLRVGWVIAHPEIVKKVEYTMDYMHVVQSFITDHIAWLIFSDETLNGSLLDNARRTAVSNLKPVMDRLSQISQFDYVTPSGGISILIRFKDGRDATPFVDQLQRDYGVVVVPGHYFGIADGFRLSYGIDEDQLRQGLEAIGKLMDETSAEIQ